MASPGYLQVDNSATTRARTFDPSFYSSGTIEVVACVAFPSWYPTAFTTRSISGSGTTTTAWAFRHVVNADATGTTPRFSWWDSDGTQHDANAGDVGDGTIFPSDGDHKWLRVVFNPDTGSGYSAQFFHSDDPIDTDPAAVTWTALATDTGAATTVRTGAGDVGFVGGNAGTGSPAGNGQHYFSSAAYNGSVVWSPDFRDDTQGWSDPPAEDNQGNSWGLAGNAVWVPPEASLLPPANLTAVAQSPSSILVSWDAVDNADAYDVERDSVIVAEKITETSYLDEGLAADTEYTYRVRSAVEIE